jgi:hypothetical protein
VHVKDTNCPWLAALTCMQLLCSVIGWNSTMRPRSIPNPMSVFSFFLHILPLHPHPPLPHLSTHTRTRARQASLSTDVQQRAYELVELSKNAGTFAAAFPVDASSATGATPQNLIFHLHLLHVLFFT